MKSRLLVHDIQGDPRAATLKAGHNLGPFSKAAAAVAPLCSDLPVIFSGGRKAWIIIPSPFFEADKARLKAQIDFLLTEDSDGAADRLMR